MNIRRITNLPDWKRLHLVAYYLRLMFWILIKKQNTPNIQEQAKLRKTFFRVTQRMEKALRCCSKGEIPWILDYISKCPDEMFKQFVRLSLRKCGHYSV